MWFKGKLKAVPGQARATENAYMREHYCVPDDDCALISDAGVVIHYIYDYNGKSYIIATRPTKIHSAAAVIVEPDVEVGYVVLAGPFEKDKQNQATQAMEQLIAKINATGQLISP